MCNSECIYWIVGATAALVMAVFLLGIALALYWKLRHPMLKNSEFHKDDVECGENLVSETNESQSLPVASLPIHNDTVYSVISDIRDGENVQMESSVPDQAISDDNNSIDSHWIIQASQITINSAIGKGKFGQVCHGVYKKSLDLQSFDQGLDVAVKTFGESDTQTARESLLTEYETLKDLNHPHVVKLIGVVFHNSAQSLAEDFLVLEYAELKSLKSLLEKCKMLEVNDGSPSRHIADKWFKKFGEPFPSPIERAKYFLSMEQIRDFSMQIADGMEYISSLRIIHRDLAARNILLTSNKVCKITDFGLSRAVGLDDAYVELSDGAVPLRWMAPECFAVRKYTSKSDVWAFGILLWELASKGMSPYKKEGVNPMNLYQYFYQGSRLAKPFTCSDQFYAVMKTCWEFGPLDRPTFKDLALMLKACTFEQKREVKEVCYNQLKLEKQNHQYIGEMLPKDGKHELNFHDLLVHSASNNTDYGYIKGKRKADSLDSSVPIIHSGSNSGELDPILSVASFAVELESRNDTNRNTKDSYFIIKPLLQNLEKTGNEKKFVPCEAPSVVPANTEVLPAFGLMWP